MLKSFFLSASSLKLVRVLFHHWTALVLLATLMGTPVAHAQIIPQTHASEDLTAITTLTDLKENLDFIFPSANYLSGFKYHSKWEEVSRKVMTETTGVEVTYQALFDQAPQSKGELPSINAYILPKASRAAAEAQFESWKKSPNFTNNLWVKTSEGRDYFSYMTQSVNNNDLVKFRPLEEASLHLVRYYDNVLIVVNFYRTSGEYNKNNVTAYLSYLANTEDTLSILNELVVFSSEALRYFVGSIFSVEGPGTYTYNPNAADYSLNIAENNIIPLNGTVSLDLYIDDASETGTVLDMNGMDTPPQGAFTLSLSGNALLEYSFYDDRIKSTCRDEAGWHHLSTTTPLELYQWQTITLGYGWIEGLKISLNGNIEATCAVNTPRASAPVYLGDYPGDTAKEGFIGYVKDLKTTFTENEGVRLDDSEGNLIFADVSENHPNAMAIQSMKDKGIIAGYANGTFRPYQSINRVEILKMLLLGFKYTVPDNMKKPKFSDVEEGTWYLPYLNLAIDRKIISGYPNGTYLPGNSLNRAEFLKILLTTYGVNVNDYPITSLYPDTDRDAWYAPYVQYSKDNNLMDGDADGNFNPGAEVSRAEGAEAIYRLAL